MTKTALLVVDLQNDYGPTGRLPLDGIDRAVANAAQVLEAARAARHRVIHIRHEVANPDAPFLASGSAGADIMPAVHPHDNETVITKAYANSFRDTPLQSMLVAGGIDNLIVIGAMSHMCVSATVRAAADFGYAVTVIHDACADRDLEFLGVTVPAAQVHASQMAALGFAYAVVVSTPDWVSGAS